MGRMCAGLRAFVLLAVAIAGQDVEDVCIEGPWSDAFGGGKAEHPIPSPPTGLKLGGEQFTIIDGGHPEHGSR
jgi:hypothetical protein